MQNLKLTLRNDCLALKEITTLEGVPVRFQAERAQNGYTVVKVTGSKRLGRQVERAEGFEEIDTYTLHQAVMAAESLTRDTFRALSRA